MTPAFPRRYVAYTAGRSTPFFLRVLEEFVRQASDEVETLEFVIGDLFSYRRALERRVDPRISIRYQHAEIDPFRRPSRLDVKRLAEMEERYGIPNLRAYVLMQRLIDRLSDPQKLAYLQTYLEYYEALWERARPDALITGGQDCLPVIAASVVLQRLGCMSLIFMTGRIRDRFLVIDNHLELIPGLGETYDALRDRPLDRTEASAVDEIRRRYVERRTRLAAFSVSHRVAALPSPRRLVETVVRRRRHDDRFFDPGFRDDLRTAALMRLRWPFHRLDHWRFVRRGLPDSKFFFFPLHYEPEASIDIQGGVHRDQFQVLQRVSRALPAGYTLCVKEHPNMFAGLRPLGFYRRVARLGNVWLLSPRIDSHDIIPRSDGVVTITSTAGFEAIMHGKPVVMFGRAFFEDFRDGVYRGGDFEATASALRRMAERPAVDPSLVDRFTAAVLRRSYPGINELAAAGVDEPANHAALARGAIAEIRFRLARSRS